MFTKSFLKKIAKKEKVPFQLLENGIRKKEIIIPLNANKNLKDVTAIGKNLKVKINTNIGTSTDKTELKGEIDKLKMAIDSGSDTIMDLSIGDNLKKAREKIIKYSTIPVGTVPIYEIAKDAENRKGSFDKIN